MTEAKALPKEEQKAYFEENKLIEAQAKRVADIKMLEAQIAEDQKKNAADKEKGLAVDEKNIKKNRALLAPI